MTDPSTTQNTEPRTTERWAYVGLRVTSKGKTAEAWTDKAGDGDVLLYPGTGTGQILGGLYDVESAHNEDRTRYGKPRYTGDSIPWSDPRCQTWITADNAARTRRLQLRNEAKASKRDAIDDAVTPLQTLAATCRTRAERDALIATVIRRLTDAWH